VRRYREEDRAHLCGATGSALQATRYSSINLGGVVMKPAKTIAVFLLALVALLHALRFFFRVPVTVGDCDIPAWASVLGTLAPGALAVWLWREG
jgi:hypothetical protein